MKRLHLYLFCSTLLLLLLSAQLQSLKSELVCSDWPICYGQFTPSLLRPQMYQFLHQLSFWGLLVGCVLWGIKRWPLIGIRAWAPTGVLGFIGAINLGIDHYHFPTITSVVVLVLFLLMIVLIESSAPIIFHSELKDKWNPRLKDIVGILLFFVVIQLILGSLLRRSSLLISCESGVEFWSCWVKQAQIPMAGGLSILHRLTGMSLSIAGIIIFSFLLKNLPKWRWVAGIGLVLMLSQLTLGLLMGRSSSKDFVMIHFTLGIGIFISLAYLLVRLRRAEFTLFQEAIATPLNDLLDLFKPRLTLLVVITLLIGVFLAPMKINVIYLFISLIAIWFQAAGSLALNSYWEREEDKLMERTKNRPLPSGRMKPLVALWWGWGLVSCGTIVLIWSANFLTAFLGLLAVAIYIFIYTPLKAIGPYALYVGAVPGALPAVMGWTTVTNTLASMGTYLFGVLFLWQIPHFLAISYFRKKEYDMARFKTFAQTHSFNFIRWNIFLYSFLLCVYSMVPYWVGIRGMGYFWSSMSLGVLFCIGALLGLWTNNPQRWSRGYFWSTLFYLPIQLGLLLIFS